MVHKAFLFSFSTCDPTFSPFLFPFSIVILYGLAALALSFKELELLNRQAVANEMAEGSTWPGSTYTKDAKKIEAPGNSFN